MPFYRQPPSATPPVNQIHPTQFVAELPSQWQGGGAASGPVNTQFRHELHEQPMRQSVYQGPPTWRRFAIPTDSDSLTSGFPYQHRLRDLGIMQDQWYQFTNEVISAAKLTKSEDYAAWGTGIATGTASSAFLLVFGPVVGYYAGKSVHKKTVVKRVKEKLAEEGELRTVLRWWNDGVFKDRGMQIWLEPPFQSSEILVDASPGMTQRDIERAAKTQARRFTIVILPYDPRNQPPAQTSSPDSPVSPQSVVQGSWNPQNTPAPQPGAQLMQYQKVGEQKYQPAIALGAPAEDRPVEVQELSVAPDDLPAAFELDCSQAAHVAR